MFEHLLYQVSDHICTITLNRPQVYNALSGALLQEITQAIHNAGADDAVRVVVLTGSGEKAFSSGADLKAGMASGMSLGESLRTNYNPLILAMRNLPKPIIGRLNGIAAGAGCSIALACDVIIAAETAALSQIFVNIGLVPDAGSSYFLPRLVGTAKAFELASTGRIVPAAECLTLGLVSQVVPVGQLDEAVAVLATQYAQAPTKAIGYMKLILNQSHENTLEQVLALEADSQDLCGHTHDAGEGIMAFLQKRKAVYLGK
jgi:2-(1,2-epoxy-1,2-dihydrophenyl)acetyl-CoA isomerase